MKPEIQSALPNEPHSIRFGQESFSLVHVGNPELREILLKTASPMSQDKNEFSLNDTRALLKSVFPERNNIRSVIDNLWSGLGRNDSPIIPFIKHSTLSEEERGITGKRGHVTKALGPESVLAFVSFAYFEPQSRQSRYAHVSWSEKTDRVIASLGGPDKQIARVITPPEVKKKNHVTGETVVDFRKDSIVVDNKKKIPQFSSDDKRELRLWTRDMGRKKFDRFNQIALMNDNLSIGPIERLSNGEYVKTRHDISAPTISAITFINSVLSGDIESYDPRTYPDDTMSITKLVRAVLSCMTPLQEKIRKDNPQSSVIIENLDDMYEVCKFLAKQAGFSEVNVQSQNNKTETLEENSSLVSSEDEDYEPNDQDILNANQWK